MSDDIKVDELVPSIFDAAEKQYEEKYAWFDKAIWKILLVIAGVDIGTSLLMAFLFASSVPITRNADMIRSSVTALCMTILSPFSLKYPKQSIWIGFAIFFSFLGIAAHLYPVVLLLGFNIKVIIIIIFAVMLGIRYF